MGSKITSTLTYIDGLAFNVELGGHTFVIDSPNPKFGGKDRGPAPKSLILPSLGGCTGMDVASILQKMRVPFTGIEVKVEAETNDHHPVYYTKIHLTYTVRGKNLDRKKVERAVELSRTTYCGVSYMLEPRTTITHEIVLTDED